MNERERAALTELKSSKKYGDICEATVERVFLEELTKRKNLKLAEKEARARLHQISGAYLTRDQLKQADGYLRAYAAGDPAALTQALNLHASTRERLPSAEALYRRAFETAGRPDTILDLACGLNPLLLGGMGLAVRGIDIHGGTNALVNRWAAACAWDVRCETCDLTMDAQLPSADLALLMKLLPVLEQQKKGAATELLARVHARWLLVSFPTRTLSGRAIGMAGSYARWMSENLPEGLKVQDEFQMGSELCYLLEAKHG